MNSDSSGIFSDRDTASALLNPITVEEARKLHNRIMSYIFTSKHKFQQEEATIMGEFITRGMALGFLAGVSTALVARRIPSLRKHPNLIGFAVAGTVDAVSRDYRRPMVYEKLLKLETPLSQKARSFLYSIRTGIEEEQPGLVNASPFASKPMERSRDAIVNTESKEQSAEKVNDWWGVDETRQSRELQSTSDQKSTNSGFSYNAPVELPSGGPFKGTRTWDDIRREGRGRAPEH